MLATTATANERVTADVAAQLGADTVTLRGSLARASLRLSVVPGLSTLEGYAWVADALATMPGSGIVYVLTVAETERLSGFLRDRGHDVAAYSGQTQNREELEDRLRAQRHQGAGRDLRAGHGVRQARSGVLPAPGLAVVAGGLLPAGRAGGPGAGRALRRRWSPDRRTSGSGSTSPPPASRPTSRSGACWACSTTGPQSLPAIEAATGIRRGRLETLLKILAVDDVVARDPAGWREGERPWFYDEAKWSALRRVRSAEADLMRRYAHGEGCLMQFLQQALDDPDPHPCGRCSVCTGELPAPGVGPDPDTVAAAQRFFRGQDVIVEPRKLWPSGLPGRKGRIAGLRPGRALAFADDPAWAQVLTSLWQQDRAAPQEVLDGMVEVLRRWSRSWERPVAVVGMPSRRFPELVGSVAEHIARIGRLPLVDALQVTGPPPSAEVSSAVRGRELLARTALRDGVRFDGPVLLIDDTIRTRWTVTVASALLVEAGATAVLPLAIHQLP